MQPNLKIAKVFEENRPEQWGVFVGGVGRSCWGAELVAIFETETQARQYVADAVPLETGANGE